MSDAPQPVAPPTVLGEGEATRALAAVSDAVLGAARELSLEAVLERLVHAARDLVGAQYAALGVPDGEGGFARFITAGMSDELIESLGPLPRTHGLLDAMLTQPTPYRTDDVMADPRFQGWWPATHPRMRSFLGYPIVFRHDVIGAFYLTDKVDGAPFDESDERMVGVLAAHAAVLLEHARLYEQSRELSVAGERERIARELHDALNQTLFGARLAIGTASTLLTDPATDRSAGFEPERPVAEITGHLQRAAELLDEAFGELRALILDLRPPDLAADRLCGAVRKQLALVERTSGIAVDLHAVGDERALDPVTEQQLFRIVQEAVANAVRHAKAHSLTVSIDVDTDRTVVEVRDDGVGFDPAAPGIRSRRLGLTSMVDRTRAVNGRIEIDSGPGRGTVVRVEAPVG